MCTLGAMVCGSGLYTSNKMWDKRLRSNIFVTGTGRRRKRPSAWHCIPTSKVARPLYCFCGLCYLKAPPNEQSGRLKSSTVTTNMREN